MQLGQQSEHARRDGEDGPGEKRGRRQRLALPARRMTGQQKRQGKIRRQNPSPRWSEFLPQHPDGQHRRYHRQPGGAGKNRLQRRDSPRVNDPVVFIGEQPAMHDLQGIAFVARDDALAFPPAGLAGVFADAATEQVIVEFGF